MRGTHCLHTLRSLQPSGPRLLTPKILPAASIASLSTQSKCFQPEFSLGSTVDDILQDTSDTNLYGPLPGQQAAEEDAQPSWEPDDIDPYKTRRVVQKCHTIRRSHRGKLCSPICAKHIILAGLQALQEVLPVAGDGESLPPLPQRTQAS